MQRTVWRNGGSNPAESAVRTWTEVARRTCSEIPPPAPSRRTLGEIGAVRS